MKMPSSASTRCESSLWSRTLPTWVIAAATIVDLTEPIVPSKPAVAAEPLQQPGRNQHQRRDHQAQPEIAVVGQVVEVLAEEADDEGQGQEDGAEDGQLLHHLVGLLGRRRPGGWPPARSSTSRVSSTISARRATWSETSRRWSTVRCEIRASLRRWRMPMVSRSGRITRRIATLVRLMRKTLVRSTSPAASIERHSRSSSWSRMRSTSGSVASTIESMWRYRIHDGPRSRATLSRAASSHTWRATAAGCRAP